MASTAETARFSEPLWPSTGIWLAAIGLGAAMGLIPAPVSVTAAVITSAVCVLAFVALLALTTPRIVVTEHEFAAGRARMPLSVVDGVQALDAASMRQALGPRLDARAYLCMRGWLPAGAMVSLRDPQDPTPYWLVSSRHPEELVDALRAGIDRSTSSAP